jgi:PIN domain nuclease of toxin-antitoxin system
MIVLDTHIWLWWLNADDSASSSNAGWRDLLSNADHVAVSAISCFEVAWLQKHDRIKLHISLSEWFEKATVGSGIYIMPITPKIAESAVGLPEHHSDPQDRLIIATAIVNQAQIISADSKFQQYEEIEDLLIRA